MKMTIECKIATLIVFCSLAWPLAWPMTGAADDTDIYVSSSQAVKPNVLIIFDNNAGMGDSAAIGDPYDPAITYACDPSPCAYTSTGVYKLVTTGQNTNYVSMNLDLSAVTCTAAHGQVDPPSGLAGYGTWTAPTSGANAGGLKNGGTCGNGGSNVVYLGNLLNYNASSTNNSTQTQIDAVQSAVTSVVNIARETIKFGLMVFGSNKSGGRILRPVLDLTSTTGQGIADYNAFIAAMPPTLLVGNGRPLAEALYDAGIYFKGPADITPVVGDYTSTAPITNENGNYASPITESCQKNFVIIITNGDTDNDGSPKLANIGDYDGDGLEPGAYGTGTHYLDDVAKYLYEKTLNPTGTLAVDERHIITHTLLVFSPQKDLLQLAANASHGRGSYHLASDASALSEALLDVLTSIVLEANTSYVAPVVPVSPQNRTYSGDYVYIGFFQPQQNSFWDGNIKKYRIANGQLVDRNGNIATDSSGNFLGTSVSYWSTAPDGGIVQEGGVGNMLQAMTLTPTANYDMTDTNLRKIYTYFGTNAQLQHTSNQFVTVNASVTPTAVGLGAADTAGRDQLVKFLHGQDAYNASTATRPWTLGDVLHSGPAIVSYDNGLLSGHTARSVIFVGANDGMLHAFEESTGKELWGYIPSDQLVNLEKLTHSSHPYLVDGTVSVYYLDNNNNGVIESGNSDKVYLIFGERRGGVAYHAINVTNPDDPYRLWDIQQGDANLTELGQTWSTPKVTKINITVGGVPVVKDVFFVAGGNDPVTESLTPAAATKGRAIYAIDITDGSRVWYYTVTNNTSMTYAFPSDLALIDHDRNGYPDRIYVGDLGARVWRFDIGDADVNNWVGRILFTSNPGADSSSGRKLLYPPDVTREVGYYFLFFGTGDREYPNDETIVNRFYAVKDLDAAFPSTPLAEGDLEDVTVNELQLDATSATDITTILSNLSTKPGWYIKLNQNAGEKFVATPVVYNKVINVPSFTPVAMAQVDPCVPNPGTGRVYALNYKTGEAVFNYDTTNDSTYTSGTNTRAQMDGGSNQLLRRSDRVKTVGAGIPSQVVIVIPEGGTGACDVMALAGVGGGVTGVEASCGGTTRRIFWKEVF